MKPFWQSKIFWVNALSALAMFLEGSEFTNVVPSQYHAYVATAVFGLNVILRFVTTSAVSFASQPEKE